MKNKKGFTLIELLVVVLIIGILAAIAVPQYQKAVMKSRLTQWATFVSSGHKAMEAWRMANSMPTDKHVRFAANAASSEMQGYLDIDLPCNSIDGTACITNFGRFNLGCNYITGHCWVDFTYTDSAGNKDTSKLIWTSQYYNGQYNNKPALERAPDDTTFRKLVCDWWAGHYGKEQMYSEVRESCEAVGI